MTYIEFILEKLKDTETGTPIYTSTLATFLAEEFDLEIHRACAATGVAMKRILDRNC